MRLFHYLVIVLSVAFLSGCTSLINDLDEDQLPKTESKLAVSGYISPQSPEIKVMITESQPLFGPSDYQPPFIANAEVIISGDNGQARLAYKDSMGTYAIDSSAFKIEAGKTYTLTVSDGKRFVKATCTVPLNAPVITNLLVEQVSTGYSSDSMARIKTTWEDIKGEKNYYMVRGYTIMEETLPMYDPKTGQVAPHRYINKYEMHYLYYENLFSDTNLDGITFNSTPVSVFLSPKREVRYLDKDGVTWHSVYNDAKMSEVGIEVLNMDENFYKFYRSLSTARDQDNPFVEPTLIYTNVEGGLGCFGAFNAAGKTFRQ